MSAGESKIQYVDVDTSQGISYFVRSDGKVDRTKGGAKVTNRIEPPEKSRYVGVAAGFHASYLLLDTGVVHRTTGRGKIGKVMNPPEGVKYIAVSGGGGGNSYFLRDDGKVDRTSNGKMLGTMEPPEKVMYIAVSAGDVASYILRDDGKVDRTTGSGKISATIENAEGKKYISISKQLNKVQSQYDASSVWANYFVTEAGDIDRTKGNADICGTINPPPGKKYTTVGCGVGISYFVRDDGVLDWTTDGSTTHSTNPSPGTKFTSVAVGLGKSYVICDDGSMYLVSGGKLGKKLVPSNDPVAKASCMIL